MKYVILFSLIFSNSSITSPKILEIRKHKQYSKLDLVEINIIENIMERAVISNRNDYYFSKLVLLLDTPIASPKIFSKEQRIETKQSVIRSKRERRIAIKRRNINLEEYTNREEIYEQRNELLWHTYRPSMNYGYFYVSYNSYTDILIHIRVYLHGDYELIKQILLLEDAIEKHLAIKGFSINLVFVDYLGEDVFKINVDPEKWPSRDNWVGDYTVIAHEVMHLTGLDDEYDRIEAHAGNGNLNIKTRLYLFEFQMSRTLPQDAKDGIMCFCHMKPLERHVCKAVGLDKKCIEARIKAFR